MFNFAAFATRGNVELLQGTCEIGKFQRAFYRIRIIQMMSTLKRARTSKNSSPIMHI